MRLRLNTSTRTRLVILALGCGVLVASPVSGRVMSLANEIGWIHSAAITLLVFVALLPARLLLLSVPLTLATLYALGQANELKIAAVALPITFLDVRLAFASPTVVLNALGISPSLVSAIAGSVLLVLVFVIACRIRMRITRNEGRRVAPVSTTVISAVALVVVLVSAERALVGYAAFVSRNLQTLYPALWLDLWMPPSQVALSRQLGVLEYLAFTYLAGDDLAESESEAAEYPRAEVRRAVQALIAQHPTGDELRPNVVIFHAESTFDPNLVFRLSERVESPLWSRTPLTAQVGPLRVNVVGGGSWVTEFEVLTGVDSRIFGYQGYYTHNYIAPLVRHSLPRWLADKGYATAAYYSVEGSFYNAERAFRQYGFQEFIGGPELGLERDWTELVDRRIITKVIESGAFGRPGPFFYFIGTSENHGPHPCRHYKTLHELGVRFVGPATFEQHCGLNEYLRRARSTADAFELVIEALVRSEAATGRPFVLLAYGDHQPWSFTDGLYSVAGGEVSDPAISRFSTLRLNSDGYLTFYHLVTSASGVVIRPFEVPPPATLLPSLVSSFVTGSHDDVYLPINFLGFARCGSDFRTPGCEISASLSRWWRDSLFHGPRSLTGAASRRDQ